MPKKHRAHVEMDAARDVFLDSIRMGADYGTALRNSKITYANMSAWKKRQSPKDQIFFKSFDDALKTRARHMTVQAEDSLYRVAKRGNVTAIKAVLYNHAPERWKSEFDTTDNKKHEGTTSTSLAEIEKLPLEEQEGEILSRIEDIVNSLADVGEDKEETKGGA